MLNSFIKQKAEIAILLFIAFTLAFFQQASIIAIVALVLVWIINKKILSTFRTLKLHPVIIVWISYFGLHLLSLLWSENLIYGSKDIETKLSLLIFPLILSTTTLSSELIKKIKIAFIAGCVAASLFCLFNAFNHYLQTNDLTAFYYQAFSYFMHTSYFTLYLNLALLFLLELVITRWNISGTLKKAVFISVVALIILNIILLSARTAIVVSLFTTLIYCIIQILKAKKGTAILIVCLIIVALGNWKITQSFNRYEQVQQAADHYHDSSKPELVNSSGYNSTTSRIEFWKNAVQVIIQNPLIGVGAGDIKEELVKQYTVNHFQYGIDHRFNPHNQYLHTGVSLGLIGLLLLLCSLLLPLFKAFKQGDWLYCCFLIMILINGITESIIERQNGIIFYAFFNMILYMESESKKRQNQMIN